MKLNCSGPSPFSIRKDGRLACTQRALSVSTLRASRPTSQALQRRSSQRQWWAASSPDGCTALTLCTTSATRTSPRVTALLWCRPDSPGPSTLSWIMTPYSAVKSSTQRCQCPCRQRSLLVSRMPSVLHVVLIFLPHYAHLCFIIPPNTPPHTRTHTPFFLFVFLFYLNLLLPQCCTWKPTEPRYISLANVLRTTPIFIWRCLIVLQLSRLQV